MEFQGTAHSLKKNKTPGPGGSPADLFSAMWCVVNNDMLDAVEESCSIDRMLNDLNSMFSALNPKMENFSYFAYLKPKPCCNTLYKP